MKTTDRITRANWLLRGGALTSLVLAFVFPFNHPTWSLCTIPVIITSIIVVLLELGER